MIEEKELLVTVSNKQTPTDSMVVLCGHMKKLANSQIAFEHRNGVRNEKADRSYWRHYLTYMQENMDRMTDPVKIGRCKATIKRIHMVNLGGML